MGWLDDKDVLEFLITLIGYASIVSAACFGLLALFTNYKVDGKPTVWARVAACGIALSATLGMTSAVLQKRADAARRDEAAQTAAKERERAQTQYDAQIAKILELNGKVTDINKVSAGILGQMGSSLTKQDRLLSAQRIMLTSARQAMLMTSGLTRQESENTGRVLKGLWDEANRIAGARIDVSIITDCTVPAGHKMPQLFADGVAMVSLYTAEEAEQEEKGELNGWSALSVMPRSMLSYTMEAVQLPGTLGGSPMSRFHSFIAIMPDEIADPEQWRTAGVRIIVNAPYRAGEIPWALTDADYKGEKVKALPCEASAVLRANGRALLEASAPIVIDKDDDGQLQLNAAFPIESVIPDSLPAFVRR